MDNLFSFELPEQQRDGKTYVQVCRSVDVVQRRGKRFFFDDETQVTLFRITEGEHSRLFAVSNICPHHHAPVLHDGYVENRNGECTVMCPKHGWTYNLATGKPIKAGVSNLHTYHVFEEQGLVWLEKPEPIVPNWKW